MSNEINYNQLEKEIFEQQNKVRQNPQSYIEKLKRVKNFFHNNKLKHPAEIPIETNEGEQGINNAIDYLYTLDKLPELILSEELNKVAKEHAKDLSNTGLTSHVNSKGEGLCERIEKYTEWEGCIAESLDFCYKYAENIIMNLIVDDGNENKSQRMNLFDPKFKYVGIGCSTHKTLKYCVVIVYATKLRKLGEQPTDIIDSIQDYINKSNLKNINNINNPFQKDDLDAPDDTVGVKIIKIKKLIEGNMKNITRKIYLLKNGYEHIVEVEDRQY